MFREVQRQQQESGVSWPLKKGRMTDVEVLFFDCREMKIDLQQFICRNFIGFADFLVPVLKSSLENVEI